jgi:hypothetical protein
MLWTIGRAIPQRLQELKTQICNLNVPKVFGWDERSSGFRPWFQYKNDSYQRWRYTSGLFVWKNSS